MRSLDVSPRSSAALLGLVLTLSFIVLPGRPVQAVDTQIGVEVCGSVTPASTVTIQSPLNDSVVDQPTVTIRGVATNATQVVIEVDDQYSSTVAMPTDSTAFTSDVALAQGTHTITAEAFGICGGASSEDSVVVTYQPATTPSNGGNVPTEVGGGGVTVNPDAVVSEAISKEEVGNPFAQLPVIGGAVNLVTNFADTIGLSGTFSANDASPIVGTARVAVTVAAVTTVVMAGSIAPVAVQTVPGISEVFHASSHRSMIYLEWVIRGVGVLALALSYFI